MFIESFPSGPFDTNAIVIGSKSTHQAAIIDPAPYSADKIIACLDENQFKPVVILLTHSHWDHIGDVALLAKKYNIPVYIHENDAMNLEKPGSDGLPMFFSIEGMKADYFLKEKDIVNVGDLKLEVIETPGHTPGGICFYIPEEGVLISGDTLFKGTIGNISFPTARPHLMWASLSKLNQLPKNTVVYPGHGPTTTLEQEHWLGRAKELFDD